MTLDNYLKKRVGKKIDYDGGFGYQCVDLARHATELLTNVKIGSFSGSAYNGRVSWSPFNTERTTIYNTTTNAPMFGDVIFWTKTHMRTNGHVAVVIEANPTNFTCIEQNGGRGSGDGLKDDAIRVSKYSYAGIAGRAHYNKNIVDPLVQQLIDNGIFNGDYGTLDKRMVLMVAKLYDKVKK